MLPPDCNFIKETVTQVLSCEFCEMFKNIFLKEHLRWLLLLFLKYYVYYRGSFPVDMHSKQRRKNNFAECLEVSVMFRTSFQKWFSHASNGISFIKSCPTLVVDFKDEHFQRTQRTTKTSKPLPWWKLHFF